MLGAAPFVLFLFQQPFSWSSNGLLTHCHMSPKCLQIHQMCTKSYGYVTCMVWNPKQNTVCHKRVRGLEVWLSLQESNHLSKQFSSVNNPEFTAVSVVDCRLLVSFLLFFFPVAAVCSGCQGDGKALPSPEAVTPEQIPASLMCRVKGSRRYKKTEQSKLETYQESAKGWDQRDKAAAEVLQAAQQVGEGVLQGPPTGAWNSGLPTSQKTNEKSASSSLPLPNPCIGYCFGGWTIARRSLLGITNSN